MMRLTRICNFWALGEGHRQIRRDEVEQLPIGLGSTPSMESGIRPEGHANEPPRQTGFNGLMSPLLYASLSQILDTCHLVKSADSGTLGGVDSPWFRGWGCLPICGAFSCKRRMTGTSER